MICINDFKKIEWDGAIKTYGNCHSTFIGLLVHWWVKLLPDHTTFEGPPSVEKRKTADILLNENGKLKGVVEVEALHPIVKLDHIKDYFNNFHELEFGILLYYYYDICKKKRTENQKREEFDQEVEKIKKEAENIVTKHNKKLYIIIVCRQREDLKDEDTKFNQIRKSNWYPAKIVKIEVIEIPGYKKEVLYTEK